jgi:hypothetical protein
MPDGFGAHVMKKIRKRFPRFTYPDSALTVVLVANAAWIGAALYH